MLDGTKCCAVALDTFIKTSANTNAYQCTCTEHRAIHDTEVISEPWGLRIDIPSSDTYATLNLEVAQIVFFGGGGLVDHCSYPYASLNIKRMRKGRYSSTDS